MNKGIKFKHNVISPIKNLTQFIVIGGIIGIAYILYSFLFIIPDKINQSKGELRSTALKIAKSLSKGSIKTSGWDTVYILDEKLHTLKVISHKKNIVKRTFNPKDMSLNGIKLTQKGKIATYTLTTTFTDKPVFVHIERNLKEVKWHYQMVAIQIGILCLLGGLMVGWIAYFVSKKIKQRKSREEVKLTVAPKDSVESFLKEIDKKELEHISWFKSEDIYQKQKELEKINP